MLYFSEVGGLVMPDTTKTPRKMLLGADLVGFVDAPRSADKASPDSPAGRGDLARTGQAKVIIKPTKPSRPGS